MKPECTILTATCHIDDTTVFLEILRDIGEKNGTDIICFDADRMAGYAHVRAALVHAWRSWQAQTAISNSFSMEALLYASGSRQCQDAARFGIHAGENRCYIAMCPPRNAALAALGSLVRFAAVDPEVMTPEKREVLCVLFGITSDELAVTGDERLTELVLERVALLDAYR